MKTIISLALIGLVLIGCQSCFKKKVKGNGTIVEKVIPITDYTGIDLSGSAKLIYEQKSDTIPYLRIEVDENIFPLIDIKVDNNQTLNIKYKKNIRPTTFNIYTNSKDLSSLEITGSGDVQFKGMLRTDALHIEISGSANIVSDSIICNILDLEIAGKGDVNLKGIASTVKYEIAGKGDINALELVADAVKCDIAGKGDISVTANKLLDIDIAGKGDIKYKGSATVSQSIAGKGKVSKLDSGESSNTIGIKQE